VPDDPPRRDIPRTLTASEAAALVGVSVATIRGWADSGLIPSHRTIGGHRRFEEGELHTWLRARGAPVAERLRPRRGAGVEVPPQPALARELNARTDRIVDRVAAGYDDEVPTPVPRATEAALARAVLRFLRVTAAALEAGRTDGVLGRAELAGLRGGLQGDTGAGVATEFGRTAVAIVAEAEEVLSARPGGGGTPMAALLSVLDAVQLAVLSGFADARGRVEEHDPEAAPALGGPGADRA
jgi:excisionase family DNA binding protein